MTKLKKIITDDGTISYYNEEFDDIYHSKVGAYKETFEKFIKPSKILENLHNYSCINVLDVCFGLGYNSKVLLSSILNQVSDLKVNIVAIENDPKIIQNSGEISFEGYQDTLKDFFQDISHKVYYKTVSSQYSKGIPFLFLLDQICFKLFVDDARQVANNLKDKYDLIFLDPFSPNKCPQLWTVDFFKVLYRLSNDKVKLLTYSSSPSIRSGLIEAGFYIGNTKPVGRKSPGTIAVKDISLLDDQLSLYEKELLESRSGIPFYDYLLNSNKESILNNRKELQKHSSKISSSQIKKKYGNV